MRGIPAMVYSLKKPISVMLLSSYHKLEFATFFFCCFLTQTLLLFSQHLNQSVFLVMFAIAWLRSGD